MEKLLMDVTMGENMRKIRKEKGFSQVEVIAKIQLIGSSISRTTYNKIEQGTRNIYVSDLIRLQRIYNVNFDEFFNNVEINTKQVVFSPIEIKKLKV